MDNILTIKDLSNMLKISKSTLYKYAEQSIIPSFKLGTSLRFYEHEIENYLLNIIKEQRKSDN